MMKSLKEAIELCKLRLSNPDMTHASRERENMHLHYHEVLQELFPNPATVATPTMKYCYRYFQPMVIQCDVCEDCLTAEKLAWNEEDEE